MKKTKLFASLATLTICAAALAPVAASAAGGVMDPIPDTGEVSASTQTHGYAKFRAGDPDKPPVIVDPDGGYDIVEDPLGSYTTGPITMRVPGFRFVAARLGSTNQVINAEYTWGKLHEAQYDPASGEVLRDEDNEIVRVAKDTYIPSIIQVNNSSGKQSSYWKVTVAQTQTFQGQDSSGATKELVNSRIRFYDESLRVTGNNVTDPTDFITGLVKDPSATGTLPYVEVAQDTPKTVFEAKDTSGGAGTSHVETNGRVASLLLTKDYDKATFYGDAFQDEIAKQHEFKMDKQADGTLLPDKTKPTTDFDKNIGKVGNKAVKLHLEKSDAAEVDVEYKSTMTWSIVAAKH